MDPIINEVLVSLIKRVEILEGQNTNKSPISTQSGTNQSQRDPGLATDRQVWKMKQLGVEPHPGITKKEAGIIIDELMSSVPQKQEQNENQEHIQESKPLTQEEIDELGEGAFL